MALLSKTEAALALNVSRQSIYNAIKEGRLSVEKDSDGVDKINSKTMREEWASKTQTRINVGPTREKRKRATKPRMAKTEESIPDYDESRARTEHLKAELLELDRKQKEGVLVKAEEVELKWVEIVTLARTKILGIPTKAKQRIPDLDTEAVTVLEDIVRETLEDLSESVADD